MRSRPQPSRSPHRARRDLTQIFLDLYNKESKAKSAELSSKLKGFAQQAKKVRRSEAARSSRVRMSASWPHTSRPHRCMLPPPGLDAQITLDNAKAAVVGKLAIQSLHTTTLKQARAERAAAPKPAGAIWDEASILGTGASSLPLQGAPPDC